MKNLLKLGLFLALPSLVWAQLPDPVYQIENLTSKSLETILNEQSISVASSQNIRIFYFQNSGKINSTNYLSSSKLDSVCTINSHLILASTGKDASSNRFWISIDSTNHLFKLHLAQIYAGMLNEFTLIPQNLPLAYELYSAYKSQAMPMSNDLFNEYYWQTLKTQDGANLYAELTERARTYKNPREFSLLKRNLLALGDSAVTASLVSQFQKNFPLEPESLEIATWEIRKMNYLLKNDIERHQLFKEYLKKVEPYKGELALRKIENHKALFLIKLYNYYREKEYDWLKMTESIAPIDRVTIYSMTAANILENQPLEAMDLVERALLVSDEKMMEDYKKENKTSFLLPEELRTKACKSKGYAFFLKGKSLFENQIYDESVDQLRKAVELNEFAYSEYIELYLKALEKVNNIGEIKNTLAKVQDSNTLKTSLKSYFEKYLDYIVIEESTPEIIDEKIKLPILSIPNTQFTKENGEILKTSHLKGEIVVIDFWENNCDKCLKSFPENYYLQKRFETKGVVFLSVNSTRNGTIDEITKNAAKELSDRGFSSFNLVFDLDGSAASSFQLSGVPTKVIIDHLGQIRYYQTEKDSSETNNFEEIIETLLSEQHRSKLGK